MAFVVTVNIERTFEVACAFDKVFDVVSDVPESAGHFPKLAELYDVGENSYLWEMEKVGVDKYSLQTSYACKYVSDRAKGTVVWTPIKGEGTALVKGKWTVKKLGPKKTSLKLSTTAELDIPLPKLVKILVAPLVSREFEGMVDQYIINLTDTFES